MTDNEIIKALKMWLREGDCNGECPLLEMGYCFDCACVPPEIVSGIFNLINRQKTEIENLKVELKAMRGAANSYKLDNERLLQKLQQAKSEALMHAFSKFAGHSDYHGDTILCQLECMAEGKETKSAIPIEMNQIKSEAIKDFAERLKKTAIGIEFGDDKKIKMAIVSTLAIDNLVKEMTEGRDEKIY